jgi:hypothetical protein
MYISSLILFGIRRSFLVSNIIVPIFVKADKTDCIYSGISLLTTTYKILPNILLSRLTLIVDEIISDLYGGFQCILPIRYYTFVKCLRTNGNTVGQYTIIQL